MAKDTQMKSDVYAADRQDSATASGKQGAQALGQGLMSGAENYRSGLAQQFQQQQAMQKMALENAQVASHVASQEMQRQEASARLFHLQQTIGTGVQAQQLRAAKYAADMAEMQLKQQQADMEKAGDVPFSERAMIAMAEHPLIDDASSPTGYSRYERIPGGWRQKSAPKEFVDRVLERQSKKEKHQLALEMQKESALADRESSRQDAARRRDEYRTESKVLENLTSSEFPNEAAITKQRERMAEIFGEGGGGGAAPSSRAAPRQKRELPPDIEQPMGVLKDGRGVHITVDYDGLFGDQGFEKPAGFDTLTDAPPELKQRAAKAKEWVRILRARAEEDKKPLDMRRLKVLVNIILRGGDPADFVK